MATQLDDFRSLRAAALGAVDNVARLRQLVIDNKIADRDREFVHSLLNAASRERGLSLKQSEWVTRLVDRYSNPTSEPQKAQIGDVRGVVALLERARQHLKFPKLWLQLPDRSDLRITIAGEHSKTPGHVVLTDGERFGSNRYYGKIAPSGELTVGRDGHAVRDQLVDLLTRLAADPAKVASEFGHLTGHCCFCSLELSDERSVAVGYGRKCAQHFGLPWGEKPS
jgi:hypothetical protein